MSQCDCDDDGMRVKIAAAGGIGADPTSRRTPGDNWQLIIKYVNTIVNQSCGGELAVSVDQNDKFHQAVRQVAQGPPD